MGGYGITVVDYKVPPFLIPLWREGINGGTEHFRVLGLKLAMARIIKQGKIWEQIVECHRTDTAFETLYQNGTCLFFHNVALMITCFLKYPNLYAYHLVYNSVLNSEFQVALFKQNLQLNIKTFSNVVGLK